MMEGFRIKPPERTGRALEVSLLHHECSDVISSSRWFFYAALVSWVLRSKHCLQALLVWRASCFGALSCEYILQAS